MQIQTMFDEVITPLLIAFGTVALTIPFLLLFHRRYEIGIWADDLIERTARWREQARAWLFQRPRVVRFLGVAWLLYALCVVGMLARSLLFHDWFQMGLWGFLTWKIITPFRQMQFPPPQAEPEPPGPAKPVLPLTAADQQAVNELYRQWQRKRSPQ